MAEMKPIQSLECGIVIKEETVDIEYDPEHMEPFPTQCQDQLMATVKAELDVASTTQVEDEVTIKEEIEAGPTELLPQYCPAEVPQCKVEPGTSDVTVMPIEFNVPCDVTIKNQADEKCNQKSSLVTDVRSHSEEKPFSCHLCSYKCNQKSTLVTHVRTHTGEKPFACDLCSYKCKQKGNLALHVRTHTGEKPFACHLCSYKCKQKCNLVKHMLTHTGEKRFACDLCSYKCSQKGTLVTHMCTHSREKPFVCNLCSHRYKYKSSLVKHMCSSTREKPLAKWRSVGYRRVEPNGNSSPPLF